MEVTEIAQQPTLTAGTGTGAARSVYVHVPFCRHRCGYCDFTLVVRRDDLIEDYLRALEIELSSVPDGHPIDTLFFGGGTPTHLPPPQLERLLRLVQQRFSLASDAEFSVEANPLDCTAERVDLLAGYGVNRLSLGVQSLNRHELEVLERNHSPAQIPEIVERVRERIPNVSLDLIFAVPGQTLEEWEETLTRAIALQPAHVSTYGLTFEKGTAFWKRRDQGQLRQVADELEREMYAAAMDRLPAAGFEHYELSNCARPLRRSRHNSVYWTGESFLAFGPGAASYTEGVRRTRHRSVTTWIRRVLAGESPIAEEEPLEGDDRAREALMLGLRLREGIHLPRFVERYGFDPVREEAAAIESFLADGLVEIENEHLRLTREGCFLADTVISALL